MKRRLKAVGIIFLFVVVCWGIMALWDHDQLEKELIRLHIVANSDREEDQEIKLRVKDAILECLQDGMKEATSVEGAKQYLEDILPALEEKANFVLEKGGFEQRVSISLSLEEFPKRIYDTFSLPSGIYQSLRVVIGEGEGHNWWCVVYPRLCLEAVSEEFESEAVSAGLSQHLVDTIQGDYKYTLHFYAMDLLGLIEKFLFS